MKKSFFYLALLSLSASCVAADLSSQQVTSLVKAAIEPLMEQQAIPGMSVAVLYKGWAQFVNFGVADLDSGRRVTENTLFELGSVSKTFTGTLAGVMIRNGEIRLNDPVQKVWLQLTGEQWRPVRMLHLATYTAGGLPLQLPEEVTDQASLLSFYQNWQPTAAPGMLDAEAYGIKSTARDMLTFMQANVDPNRLSAGNAVLRNAIRTAQSRYFKVGSLNQGLGWEIYDWPVAVDTLLGDNDNDVALKPRPATQVNPVGPSQSASWVHKTGATRGFGAYIAFIPEQNSGIVLLANKNYPNPLRIRAAWQILQALQQGAPE